jgi:hypothetical protein
MCTPAVSRSTSVCTALVMKLSRDRRRGTNERLESISAIPVRRHPECAHSQYALLNRALAHYTLGMDLLRRCRTTARIGCALLALMIAPIVYADARDTTLVTLTARSTTGAGADVLYTLAAPTNGTSASFVYITLPYGYLALLVGSVSTTANSLTLAQYSGTLLASGTAPTTALAVLNAVTAGSTLPTLSTSAGLTIDLTQQTSVTLAVFDVLDSATYIAVVTRPSIIAVLCAQSPCQNAGVCTNTLDANSNPTGYTCACTTLYTGPTCAVLIAAAPLAVISTSAFTSACSVIVLDGSGSLNVNALSVYAWSVSSLSVAGTSVYTSASGTFASNAAVAASTPLTSVATALAATTAIISINGALFADGSIVVFTLIVTNLGVPPSAVVLSRSVVHRMWRHGCRQSL